jgi:uncharacterized protein YndB with AHSA1/START domain
MHAAASRGSDRKLIVEAVGDREVVMTRVVAAPRRLVFEAWTDPAQVPHWLGPRAHTMIQCDIDLRVGGKYRYVFQLANGHRMGMGGVYREIDPPARLVSTEAFDDFPGEAVCTLTLVEQDGKTTVTMHILADTRAARDGMLASGMDRGVEEGFQRMEELLAPRMA